jgi:hypothetical protein
VTAVGELVLAVESVELELIGALSLESALAAVATVLRALPNEPAAYTAPQNARSSATVRALTRRRRTLVRRARACSRRSSSRERGG